MEDDEGGSRQGDSSDEQSSPSDHTDDQPSPGDRSSEQSPRDGGPAEQSSPDGLETAPGSQPQQDHQREGPANQVAQAEEKPPKTTVTDDDTPDPASNPVAWYLNSTNGLVVASRDVLVTVAMVAVIGLVLFAITGVWPPLVAVESGSMEPNMKQGDLVLIVDNERFTHPEAHDDTGIITSEVGEEIGHESFGEPGNVIVFQGDGQDGTPIIHRARYHVEADENWYDRADGNSTASYTGCDEMPHGACPAPHDGFVTQGDANTAYDQLEGQSVVVRDEWIQGKAVARVPWLGCIRLELTSDRTCLDGRN